MIPEPLPLAGLIENVIGPPSVSAQKFLRKFLPAPRFLRSILRYFQMRRRSPA
jgi:hypothetical protein